MIAIILTDFYHLSVYLFLMLEVGIEPTVTDDIYKNYNESVSVITTSHLKTKVDIWRLRASI